MQLDAIGFNHRHERSFRIDRPEGSEDWLMLIVKSPACFIIDGKEIKTRANSFIVFTSDHPQHYFPECDEYFDDWIHFVPDSDDISLFEELNIPLNRPVPLSDISDISLFVKNMCYEYYSSNANRRQSVLMYFRLLMYKLSEKQILSPADRPSGDNAYAESSAGSESRFSAGRRGILWMIWQESSLSAVQGSSTSTVRPSVRAYPRIF